MPPFDSAQDDISLNVVMLSGVEASLFKPTVSLPVMPPFDSAQDDISLNVVMLSGVEASILKVAISCLPLEGESKREEQVISF
jgi:hypothetical protein